MKPETESKYIGRNKAPIITGLARALPKTEMDCALETTINGTRPDYEEKFRCPRPRPTNTTRY